MSQRRKRYCRIESDLTHTRPRGPNSGSGSSLVRRRRAALRGSRLSARASRGESGGAHACAITSGSLTCWGSNTNGQLGVPTPSPANGSPPTTVPGLSGVTDVSAGSNTTCAVVAGSLYCWGFNGSGQVGDGTFTTRTSPVSVGLTGVASVAVGPISTCARQNSGVIYCFGNNASGAVGAALPYVLTPARVM